MALNSIKLFREQQMKSNILDSGSTYTDSQPTSQPKLLVIVAVLAADSVEIHRWKVGRVGVKVAVYDEVFFCGKNLFTHSAWLPER